MFPGKSADEKKMAVHLLVIYFQYVEPNPPMSPWSSPWKVYTWTASVTGPVTDDNKPSVWKQFFKYLWFTSFDFLFGGEPMLFEKNLQKQRHETKASDFQRNLDFFVGVVSLVNRSSVRIQDTARIQRPLPTLDPGPSIFRRSGSQRWRASTSWPGRKSHSFRTSGSTLSKL